MTPELDSYNMEPFANNGITQRKYISRGVLLSYFTISAIVLCSFAKVPLEPYLGGLMMQVADGRFIAFWVCEIPMYHGPKHWVYGFGYNNKELKIYVNL
jgi:hypothetical protein